MAKIEEQYPLDYRNGGDTIDDFAQKYMKQINAIIQFLNNLREHNSNGPIQIEPQPYQLKAEDGKLYIRNDGNDKWLYLFDVKYRMGFSDNAEAVILTTDDVTTTGEALKLVKTNADGMIDADLAGNADTATALKEKRNFAIADNAGENSGKAVLFDGSSDVTLKLPELIKGKFDGSFKGALSGTFEGDAPEYIRQDTIENVPNNAIACTPNKLAVINANGLLPVDILGNAGKLAGVSVAITNPEDGQVLAFRAASRTWTNEARAVVGEGKALNIYDGDKLLAEYSGGKTVALDLGVSKAKDDMRKELDDAVVEMRQTIADFFDVDEFGGIMPAEYPNFSNQFELDDNGAIMPKDV